MQTPAATPDPRASKSPQRKLSFGEKNINSKILLQQYSVSIIESGNNRDWITPVRKYASNDYVFEAVSNDGSLITLDVAGMYRMRDWFFLEKSPAAYGEVRDVLVHLNEHAAEAAVWVNYIMHGDKQTLQREKTTIFFWRRESTRHGSDWQKWFWWKEHTSAGIINVAGDASVS